MKIRLGLVFKDFACWLLDTSSVGLNVAGYTTAKVLEEHGVHTIVFPVRHNIDLVDAINKYNDSHEHPLTHVVISAPWLSVFDLQNLISNFKSIKFVVLSHSNVGFLQADAHGVELLRAYQELTKSFPNLRVGGNSKKFVEWFSECYATERRPIEFLPNLYPLKGARPIGRWLGDPPLRIGAFGAVRPYKNFMTAAAAALLIQRELDVPVEFHMSDGGEGDNGMVMPAIEAMLKDTGVTLIKHKWCYWNNFIKLIRGMDLLIQVSYTESFNLITADGILGGVSSVVSSAVRWAPESWKADSDDAVNVAQTGLELLFSPEPFAGIKSLTESNSRGILQWFRFLGIQTRREPGLFDRIKNLFGGH